MTENKQEQNYVLSMFFRKDNTAIVMGLAEAVDPTLKTDASSHELRFQMSHKKQML